MAYSGTVKAAVLGCGPAGLLAAHGFARGAAALNMKAEVKIYSRKKKSPLYGCQYLHKPIPGLTLAHQAVEYRLLGSVEDYRAKVYGENEDVMVSPATLDEDHSAWDIRAAYDQLWNLYEPAVEDYFLTPGSLKVLRRTLAEQGISTIISTVPRPILCDAFLRQEDHTFGGEDVWVMGDAPELNRMARVAHSLPEGSILCSGRPEEDWYRLAHVFGHRTVEWPVNAAPPHGASRVRKPTTTTCDCHSDLIMSGRFARWEKGVLAHESYDDGYRVAVAMAASRLVGSEGA